MASLTVTITGYVSTVYYVASDGDSTGTVPADVEAATLAALSGAGSIGVRVRLDTRTPQRPIITGIDTSGA
jgi:hypothetical protein